MGYAQRQMFENGSAATPSNGRVAIAVAQPFANQVHSGEIESGVRLAIIFGFGAASWAAVALIGKLALALV